VLRNSFVAYFALNCALFVKIASGFVTNFATDHFSKLAVYVSSKIMDISLELSELFISFFIYNKWKLRCNKVCFRHGVRIIYSMRQKNTHDIIRS